MSFCFLYNVVSENYSVQNSPWGGGGPIASSRSNSLKEKRPRIYIKLLDYLDRGGGGILTAKINLRQCHFHQTAKF